MNHHESTEWTVTEGKLTTIKMKIHNLDLYPLAQLQLSETIR